VCEHLADVVGKTRFEAKVTLRTSHSQSLAAAHVHASLAIHGVQGFRVDTVTGTFFFIIKSNRRKYIYHFFTIRACMVYASMQALEV